MVMLQTANIYREMADCEGLSDKDSVVIANFNRLPLRVSRSL